MKAAKDFSEYLTEIVEYAEKSIHFIDGIDFEEFRANEEKSLAVIRCLEVIGEAARNVPRHVRKSYVKVPWEEMTGMRDKLIHDYFGVNLDVVWRTVREDLPPMKQAVQDMIEDLRSHKR